MRIAQLANFYGPTSGGLRVALDELGRQYRAAGHCRLLVVPGPTDRVVSGEAGIVAEIASPRLPGSGGYQVITRLDAVTRVLERFGPDAIEVSDKLTLARLGSWAAEQGVRSMLISHERLDGLVATRTRPGRAALRRRAAAQRYSARVARRFDVVVACSRYAAAELVGQGVDVVTVPLGVDLEVFAPAGPPRNPRPVLVAVGRLHHEKRPELAIDTVRALTRAGVDVELVMVGSGPLCAELWRRAHGLPIRFVPHVADRRTLAGLVARSDVALACGPVETFGLAALEALACGVPVVGSLDGAVGEVIGDGGRVVDGTPTAFAAGVRSVLAEPPAARRARARARAEGFPWSACAGRLLDLHASVTRRPPDGHRRARSAMPSRRLADIGRCHADVEPEEGRG